MRRQVYGIMVIVLLPMAILGSAHATMFKSITFDSLVAESDLIVMGSVTRVFSVGGVEVAELGSIDRAVLKGEAPDKLIFWSQGQSNKRSTSVEGEQALLFMKQYEFDPSPSQNYPYMEDVAAVADTMLRFRYYYFKEPVGFKEAITARYPNQKFFLIFYGGFGRLPISIVDGKSAVKAAHLIGLQDVAPSEPAPSEGESGKYGYFYVRVQLDTVVAIVSKVLSDSGPKAAGEK